MNEEQFERASCQFKSHYGEGTLHVFNFGKHEEDNILVVEAHPPESAPKVPLVRVQSACYTAEIFRATDCDCHEQLDNSLNRVHAEGGYVIYMPCDGRGAGLLTEIRGLALGDTAQLDTYEAYVTLGVEPDPRDYARVSQVASALGLTSIRLLTNNPRKIEGLKQFGITVEHTPLTIPATADSRSYLVTKQSKFGHLFNYLSE